ncbi:MAG: hypothetical protein QM791_20635 [Ferruginibacter sp.]
MHKINLTVLLYFISACTVAQNVGIGTNAPLDKLDVNGNVRSNGLLISNSNVIELGVGISKQTDNGKIAYHAFGEANTLSIVGGGVASDGSDRRIKFWANGGSEFTGGARFSGAVGIGTAAGLSQLTIRAGNAATLSLQNSNALNTGVTTGIYLGGGDYTTAAIQSIGNSNNSARLALFTGYSFGGGINNLAERFTISNSGMIGINQSLPAATLDVGGSIRFSGANPAAFVLTATAGINMYNSSFLLTTDDLASKFIRINHPHCNNDPNAIILATAINRAVPVNCTYNPGDGYWYLNHYREFSVTGIATANWKLCDNGCASGTENRYPTASTYTFTGGDKYNVFVIKN